MKDYSEMSFDELEKSIETLNKNMASTLPNKGQIPENYHHYEIDVKNYYLLGAMNQALIIKKNRRPIGQ